MSVYLPECNANASLSNAVYYVLPTGSAVGKPANTGCVTLFWFKTPEFGYDASVVSAMLTKNIGDANGNDTYIRANKACTTLSVSVRYFGTQYAGSGSGLSVAISPGKTYLCMFIVCAARVHFLVCEPGGSPVVATAATSAFYALGVTSDPLWARIGGASGTLTHYGPIEEVCYWTGLFPEVSSAPDTTLVEAIADGTQDLDTLVSSLTGSNVAEKFRYRLVLPEDITDTFAVTSDLTVMNTSVDKVIMGSGPLRPVAVMPAWSSACASQVQFTVPGDSATATAMIKTPAGTYTGITPDGIQARLVKEDRSVLVAWETVSTPSAGTWAEGQFAAAVPMTAGWLELQMRAVDSGGAQLGDTVAAYGSVGAGFNFIAEGQSQLMIQFTHDSAGSPALPSASRAAVTHFTVGGPIAAPRILTYANAITRTGRGMVQLIKEINALYPGVPVSINAVGVVGQNINAFLSGGGYYTNWATLKTCLGVTQPYFFVNYSHSSVSGTPTSADYEVLIEDVKDVCEAHFGPALKSILCPTSRYAGTGSTGDYPMVNVIRTAVRDHVIADPTGFFHGGSWQPIKSDTSDVGPHSNGSFTVGGGRAGSYLGFALMAASRAIKQQPMHIASVTPSGTTIRLKFGPVNAM